MSAATLSVWHRQALLDTAEIREAILTSADLARADTVLLLNAVRGQVGMHKIS